MVLRAFAAAAMVALAAWVPAASAEDVCRTTLLLTIDLGPAGIFYYEDRSEVPPVPGMLVGPGGTWIWEEANGLPGLQRGGESWILDLDDDPWPDPAWNCDPYPWDRLWL